jgi:smad nuclear-interacting protein 1
MRDEREESQAWRQRSPSSKASRPRSYHSRRRSPSVDPLNSDNDRTHRNGHRHTHQRQEDGDVGGYRDYKRRRLSESPSDFEGLRNQETRSSEYTKRRSSPSPSWRPPSHSDHRSRGRNGHSWRDKPTSPVQREGRGSYSHDGRPSRSSRELEASTRRRSRSKSPNRDRRAERHRRPRSTSRSPRSRHSRRDRSTSSRRRPRKSKSPSPFRRSKKPLADQQAAFTQDSSTAVVKASPPPDKQKPNYAPTGKLAAATNTTATGIVLKYNEPPEARKPPSSQQWRLYVFKGSEIVDTLEISTRSCWLFGRERLVVDYPLDHPSCSKQHAVIQFRHIQKVGGFGDRIGAVKPYVLDLESANGTKINGETMEASRYIELMDKDIIQFGHSSREYVMMLPPPRGQ